MKHNQDRRMQRKSAKPGTVGPDGKVSGGGGGSRNKGSKAETTVGLSVSHHRFQGISDPESSANAATVVLLVT